MAARVLNKTTEPLPQWPCFDEAQIAAVAQVLRSGKVNYWHGERCREFEHAFANYCAMPYAISVANGTLALELALLAFGIGPGDEVIVPARSFIATASAVLTRGAVPVFCDIDSQSENIDAVCVARQITPRTRAIIAVHLSGWPCDMAALTSLARAHQLLLIEDCAQAHGAAIGDRRVGGFGDAAAFSFCQDKIVSTGGEGGMLLLRDADAWQRAWAYKDHGKPPETLTAKPGPRYRYVHDSAGSNWRMNECQAAIGLLQLRQLDLWVARRQRNAARLAGQIGAVGALTAPSPPLSLCHARYRLALQVQRERLRSGWDTGRLIAGLQAAGVPCSAGVCPELYRERALQAYAPPERLPVAKQLGQVSLCLTVHPTLEDRHIDWIGETVGEIVTFATGC